MRQQKMPTNARLAVFDALQSDDDFRLRVWQVADEATVGVAGMVLLGHEPNWRATLDELLVGAPSSNDRRVVQAQKALREVKAELVAVKAELTATQRTLKAAETAAAKFEKTRLGMEQEIAGLKGKLDRSDADRSALFSELRQLTDLLDAKDQELHDAAGDGDGWQAMFVPDPDTVDFAQLSADLAAAEDANMALSEALAVVRRALYRPEGGQPARTASVVQLVPPLESKRVAKASTPRKKRHRVRLPGGVLAESVEAARFLLSRTDVIHVIDGYNVAKLAYPNASLVQQREQLLDVADGLLARLGTPIIVVFDGDEVGPTKAPRHQVGVKYSPAGITADDVIISWLTAQPLEQAVVVVTSDNAVRSAGDMLGAHLVRSPEFLVAAGRK